MRIEAVTIGNELLNGELTDSNTSRFGALLRGRGLLLQGAQTVPDDPDAIIAALTRAGSGADLVLVSGGLGPTDDDLTMAAAARFAGETMRVDVPTLASIKARYAQRGRPFNSMNNRQAEIPEKAVALPNRHGTAPCVRMAVRGTTYFFFPGVPRELQALLSDHLEPWLEQQGTRPATVSHVFKTFGKTESQIATLLAPLADTATLHVAYRAHFPEIIVTLHINETDPQLRADLLATCTAEARERLGALVYTEAAAETMATVVGRQLMGQNATVSTAESCTGGGLSALLTSVPGASAWFSESMITYTNASKHTRLGVPQELITTEGAVSESVCRAMAMGLRATTGTTYAIAITGIAGPGGGSREKPVGTVHLAIDAEGGCQHRRLVLPFDRAHNRTLTAWLALDQLRQLLTQ